MFEKSDFSKIPELREKSGIVHKQGNKISDKAGRSDMRSTTGRNISYLKRLCENFFDEENLKIKELLPRADACEPWRTSLLSTLLEARLSKSLTSLNLTWNQLEAMINSLCSS